MKIQLLKTEGNWVQASLGCYISVNNNLIDVITPLNSPHETSTMDLPAEGTLRIVIRDMGKPDGYLASLSISLSLLTISQGLWLPLQEVSLNDAITQLQDEVSSPRVLISIHNDLFDIDELFLTNQEIEPDSICEVFLASEIVTSQEPENLFLKTSNFNFGDEENAKGQKVVDVLNMEIDNYKYSVMQEKEVNDNLKKRVIGLIETVKNNAERANMREVSLLELINEKDLEIAKGLEMNRKMQNLVRKLELENRDLMEKLERVSSQLENNGSLEREIEFYKESLKFSEGNIEKLTNTVIGLSKADQDDKNTEGTMERNEVSEDLNNTVKENIVKVDENEQSVKENLCRIIGNFTEIREITRISECIYKVNGIELHLAFTSEGIYINQNLTLCTIGNFWQSLTKPKCQVVHIPENILKKPQKSPKKSILKPTNSHQKYVSVLPHSPNKEFKPLPRKSISK